ncbi:hypothetical protein RIF29_29413 [Crotalaria pallida]|uniref:Core Histone H2A/H2B/H3 domain-containing protein n=1 Tax=Crotalaria pallida TaxID=3830 RepID=A0AAN9HW93_CROPI
MARVSGKRPQMKKLVTEEKTLVVKKNIAKEGSSKNKNRRSKKHIQTYKIYISKVLKRVHPNLRISSKAMGIMNSFMVDMFDKLAQESSRLALYNEKSTITTREIQSAVRLILPSELAKHAVSEGTKAITKFISS